MKQAKYLHGLVLKKTLRSFLPETDLYLHLSSITDSENLAAVLIDEAQWLTVKQVWQLARFVDDRKVPVMCYGLRTDFKGSLFDGSKALLAIADELREIRTICKCGRKAVMTLRLDENREAIIDGPQTQVGGNETYESVCRYHWQKAVNASEKSRKESEIN